MTRLILWLGRVKWCMTSGSVDLCTVRRTINVRNATVSKSYEMCNVKETDFIFVLSMIPSCRMFLAGDQTNFVKGLRSRKNI